MDIFNNGIFNENVIDLDLKQDYNLGYDIECHQNDDLNLQFTIRNNGELINLDDFNIDFRVKKPDGTDYIQSVFDIKKDVIGNLVIVCDNTLTSIEGKAKGEIRLWDKQYKQQTSRMLTIRIKPSVLQVDNKVHESTITILNHLDLSIDKANNFIIDIDKQTETLRNTINLAKETDSHLESTTNEGKRISTELQGKIDVSVQKINTLDQKNGIATTNLTNLDTKNGIADENIKNLDSKNGIATTNLTNLDSKNGIADENIKNLDSKNKTSSENIKNLDSKNGIATTNINNLDSKNTLASTNIKELNNSITLAGEKISKIEELKQTPNVEDLASIKKEVQDSKGTFATLNERITSAENSGGFYIGENLPPIADRNSKILYMKILSDSPTKDEVSKLKVATKDEVLEVVKEVLGG